MFAAPRSLKIQELAQRAVHGPRLTHVPIHGRPFECWTSEKYYWLRDAYEARLRKELEKLLAPGCIFYDIGSHAGFWPVMLADRCKHVFAFEPSPVNFARLQRNVAHLPNVTPVHAAVSDVSGVLRLSGGGTTTHVDASGVEVESVSLRDFARFHPAPDVIKVDVEGHGAKVLAGMGELAPKIVMEVHNAEERQALVRIHHEDKGRHLFWSRASRLTSPLE